MKRPFIIFLSCCLATVAFAQSPQNIYKDAMFLKNKCISNGKLDPGKADEWLPVLQKYVKAGVQGQTDIIKSFDGNPMGLFSTDMITVPDAKKNFTLKNWSMMKIDELKAMGPAQATNTALTGNGALSAAAVADDLTKLIIERGKQELTASFFAQMKTLLAKNPELGIAFPKTTKFITHIETYLYASYLQTLREAFASDINDLPMHAGAIMNTSRIRDYLKVNVRSDLVWAVVPALTFVGNLRDGQTLPDAIKALTPDEILKSSNKNVYNFLRFTMVCSEALRDPATPGEYINTNDLIAFLKDDVSAKLFFGLLYQEITNLDLIKPAFDQTHLAELRIFIQSFTEGYLTTRTAIDQLKNTVKSGNSIKFTDLLDIVNKSQDGLQSTLDAVNVLLAAQKLGKIDAGSAFAALPKITEALSEFNNKNYAAGVMTTLLIISDYIGPKGKNIQPFMNKVELDIKDLDNASAKDHLQLALVVVQQYEAQYPSDNFCKFIRKLKAEIKNITTAAATTDQVNSAKALLETIQKADYNFDGDRIYQQLLKYGTLMAALAEARNDAAVNAALEAAILPVGSSAIKGNTICSFSLNSYIGGGFYGANYKPQGAATYLIHTAGVALPIGPNFSLGLRNHVVGAVSLFASVVDLGAIASYRLSSPDNAATQMLPSFTFQNLLAPGGFLVVNRILNTPLAIGAGWQRAPQLAAIKDGTADITTTPQWRFGGFLTLDIPLFNLYAKSLRRPLKD